jgi:hypothetical protein
MDDARESYGRIMRSLLARQLVTDAQCERILAGFADGFAAGWYAREDVDRAQLGAVERAPGDGEE